MSVTELTMAVFVGIVVKLLTPTIRRFWLSFIRYVRHRYIWLDSTQRLIDSRQRWRKDCAIANRLYLVIATIARVVDLEYMAWRKKTKANNVRLYRQGQITRWERYSRVNIEECLVEESYIQFLEFKMDEDLAEFSVGNKSMSDSFRMWRGEPVSARDEYKCEFDKHIEFIENKQRYKSVLDWGYRSSRPPDIVAKVYEEKSLPFPEDYHIRAGEGRVVKLGHVYRFLAKRFPDRDVA